MSNNFPALWSTFDIRPILPPDWRLQVNQLANSAKLKPLLPQSVTSREMDLEHTITSLVVNGKIITEKLPWLFILYRSILRDYVERVIGDRVAVAESPLHSIAINVMLGGEMRYECHIDSNPIGAMLYTESFAEGKGGELVFCNNPNAKSIEDVDREPSILYPQQGYFYIFDGRTYPHYVRPVLKNGRKRVAIVFNYYTDKCTEADRPADLDTHLFGDLD